MKFPENSAAETISNGRKTLGIGVIGCGGFGHFAMQHFLQNPEIKLVGITATHREAAYAAAKRFDVELFEDINEFLKIPGLDIVYISTPPFLHYEHSMLALNAGKNVICEKPLALTREQADEMINIASEKSLLLITNLMQRYNPLYEKMSALIDEKPLGEMIHGYFENYASDEGLLEDHWFWDRDKSGGIFIEHGVHFFDMFEGWLGKGKVVSAQAEKRPGKDMEDQVQCTVKYNNNVLINFYHGFTQAGRMDRQEMRLLFERGDVTLYEWIPDKAIINAIANEVDTKKLLEIFPGSKLDITSVYAGKDRAVRARGKELDIYQRIKVSYGFDNEKMHVYGDILKRIINDQIKWMENKDHKRVITEQNGYNSLMMAIDAADLAKTNYI
jgi:predicted dehydrogenase